jgi:hypothetical protein
MNYKQDLFSTSNTYETICIKALIYTGNRKRLLKKKDLLERAIGRII